MVDEPQIISQILHNTRRLSKWYLSFLPDDLFMQRIDVQGRKINSPFWIIAHMAWTEGSIVEGMGGPAIAQEWQRFRLGSNEADPSDWPSIEHLKSQFHEVHKTAGSWISEMPADRLDLDYPIAAFHRIFKTNREALYHIIRHEGYHCGQLGLICKMHGIKTI